MSLIRRRPNHDLARLSDLMESFFDDAAPSMRFGSMSPFATFREDIPLDILEEKNTIIVKAAVPGIKADDLHVMVEDDRVRVWGEAREDSEHKDEVYYLREHRYGRIERVARLPYAVDSEGPKADIESGMLTLTLPKAPQAKQKEIKVEAK